MAGSRYPFAPPVGLMYVLWDSDEAFEHWLGTAPDPAGDASTARTCARVVAECRERGYLVEGLTEVGPAVAYADGRRRRLRSTRRGARPGR